MDSFEGEVVHPQDVAGRRRPRGQARRGDRLGRDRRDADPGHRGRRRARHDAAALADVLLRPPELATSSPTRCASLDVPEEWTHEIVRRQIVKMQRRDDAHGARLPRHGCARSCIEAIRPQLPEGFDVEKHFNPPYRPWQQRIAVRARRRPVQGDQRRARRRSSPTRSSVHRDGHRARRRASTLEADVIITATGFDLSRPRRRRVHRRRRTGRLRRHGHLPRDHVHRRARTSRTSSATSAPAGRCAPTSSATSSAACSPTWTSAGSTMVVPALRDDDADMELVPWVEPENFNPGYLTRSLHLMPKQGAHDPVAAAATTTPWRARCSRGRLRRRHRSSSSSRASVEPEATAGCCSDMMRRLGVLLLLVLAACAGPEEISGVGPGDGEAPPALDGRTFLSARSPDTSSSPVRGSSCPSTRATSARPPAATRSARRTRWMATRSSPRARA